MQLPFSKARTGKNQLNTVRIENSHSGRRLHLEGDITVYSACGFRDAVLAAVPTAGELEVDLSGVREIDSVGLQILLQLKNRHANAIRFTNHSPAVRQVLTLSRIAADFDDLVVRSSSRKIATAVREAGASKSAAGSGLS